MYAIIGLGNPGETYDGTRHNLGREIVRKAAKAMGLGDFEHDPALNGRITEGKVGRERVLLLLPETFVNKSGSSVAPTLKRHRIKPKDLILVHDDVDILLGAAKLAFGKNSGGHKGVESVMRALKTKNFWRMRVGVQKKRRVPGEDLVLQKFRRDESVTITKVVKKSVDALRTILEAGPERTMNSYNH